MKEIPQGLFYPNDKIEIKGFNGADTIVGSRTYSNEIFGGIDDIDKDGGDLLGLVRCVRN